MLLGSIAVIVASELVAPIEIVQSVFSPVWSSVEVNPLAEAEYGFKYFGPSWSKRSFDVPSSQFSSSPKDGLKNEEQTPAVHGNDQAVHTYPAQDIEINNRDIPTKPRTNISGLEITDEIKVPEEKIVYIKRPVAERKKEIAPKPEKGGFVF